MKRMSGTAPRTAAAIDARRATTEEMLQRVRQAIRQMGREHAAITTAAVARRAHVSRTFLYQNTHARQLISSSSSDHLRPRDENRASEVEASWRERALNAEEQLRRACDEVILQRNRMGELLGQIRDLEADLPADGVQRLLSETHTLKGQIRQLSQENRRLEERLTGARDNNRFLDKRIAALEAELLDRPQS